jgi:hypothetical protein
MTTRSPEGSPNSRKITSTAPRPAFSIKMTLGIRNFSVAS